MKLKDDAIWKQIVARLNVAYESLGRQGLEKMTAVEVHVLLSEKTVDVRQSKSWRKQYPEDELGKLRHEKAEAAVADISSWLKEKSAPSHETPTKAPEPKAILQMLDDVEAVTKSTYYADPEPIASPIEMFRLPAGAGGEPFSSLSRREKWQVLEDYTHWQDYEKQGIGFGPLDQVFGNVIDGKPREQWMEGTGLVLPAERTPKSTLEKLRIEIEADAKAAQSEPERLERRRAEKLQGPPEVPTRKSKDNDRDMER
jgi:hypothetical protein